MKVEFADAITTHTWKAKSKNLSMNRCSNLRPQPCRKIIIGNAVDVGNGAFDDLKKNGNSDEQSKEPSSGY